MLTIKSVNHVNPLFKLYSGFFVRNDRFINSWFL